MSTYENCVEMNRQHPDTFEIPTGGEIAGLMPGDYVKLIFLLPPNLPGMPASERMWVEVTEVDQPEAGSFRGRLSNTPVFLKDTKFGELVTPFRAEHIASVMYTRPKTVQ